MTIEHSNDETFAARVLSREVRAGARLMRLIDDRHPRAVAILRHIHQTISLRGEAHTPAHVIGLTGNPGAGKSTLGAALVAHWRGLGKRVGVIAVDPSSPFSGGAILGDRIRMAEHAVDDDVFIRSVATRGHMGGLSRSANDMVTVMDAMGYDPILVETVGVGQDEIDVIKVAQTTAVVLVPGLGDEIQAIKAGLLEIADVFVVNKADRDGALRAEKDLRMLQSLGPTHAWEIPIVRTVATAREGIAELVGALDAHRAQLVVDPAVALERSRMRARHVIESLVHDRVSAAMQRAFDAESSAIDAVVARASDPWSEADRLFRQVMDDRGQA